MNGSTRNAAVAALFFLALLVGGCNTNTTASLEEVLRAIGTRPGWQPSGDVEIFDRDTLFDLVDGQADSFFAYGFERVAVQDYENEGNLLTAEVWEMATPADAQGLFTISSSGEPASVGNGGDTDPGRRLAFWQDRYFVQLRARNELTDDELEILGEAITDQLPLGGEGSPLLDRLPDQGMAPPSGLFFHEEISIQDYVWLGGVNSLGLNAETDGVLAQYDLAGANVQFLLIRYPDAEAASAGLAALRDGSISNVAAAAARDELLGAILGDVDASAANALLEKALDDG